MYFHFLSMGYPHDIIVKGWKSATHNTRQSLLNPLREKNEEHPLRLITTYNGGNPTLKEIIYKYWPILHRSSATSSLVNRHNGHI